MLNPSPAHKWIVVRVIDRRDWSVAEKHHACHESELGETIWELLQSACEQVGIAAQRYHPTSVTEMSNYTLENDKHIVKIEVADALTHDEMVELGLIESDTVTLPTDVWGRLFNSADARRLDNMLKEND